MSKRVRGGDLELLAMTEQDFTDFQKISRESYAKNKEREEGLSPEAAQQTADETFAELLPHGIQTPSHYFFQVKEKATKNTIGILWYQFPRPKTAHEAWVLELLVFESSRGRGYGRRTMELFQADAVARGAKILGLHVFGSNQVAQNLYRSLGYEPTNLVLRKWLTPPSR